MSSNALNDLASIKSLQSAWNGLNKSNPSSRGMDKVTILDFKRDLFRSLNVLRSELRNASFIFRQLKSVDIPKDRLNPSRGTRTLKIPCIRDRVVLKALQEFVSPRLRKFNAPFSYAYQEDRNVERAVAEILELCREYRFAVEADIKNYFDQIPIKSLADSLFKVLPQPTLKPLIESALEVETAIVDVSGESSADYFMDDPRGIPQGSALSPTLANYYLTPLDYLMAEARIPTIRYADDLVFFANTEEKAIEAYEIAKRALQTLGLDLHPIGTDKTSKSRIRDLKVEGLESLGYRIEQGKVQPGSRFVRRLTDEIREITNPTSVGVGFKGAPTTWIEDTVLSRAYHLRKKIEGKAAAIRLAENCPQITDVDKILLEGFYNLFTACEINLTNIPKKSSNKLGIPSFTEIWEKKSHPVPPATLTQDSIFRWLKEVSPSIRRAFPQIKKPRKANISMVAE